MAAEFGISIAEKLFEAIGSKLIKEVCDMWGYKSRLEDLTHTVSTIHKVLLDAGAKPELSNQERDYIVKLKDAFLTLAELKQLRPLSKHGKFFEKVRCFFSSKNQLGEAYRMSRDVKDIKMRLDDIANERIKFEFIVDYNPICKRREETCSYVVASDIIGRDKDKEAIIDMILDHNNEDFCILTIVGVGGLGKTTLSQLVYNDERIEKEFPILSLLRRCFFEKVKKPLEENIEYVKIHDLMHDVAQEVGKEEIHVVTSVTNKLGDKIRHVHYVGDSCLGSCLSSGKIRSFVCNGYENFVVNTQIDSWMCLRVLDLCDLSLKELPDSIGKLLHLRYLNLSKNRDLPVLPNAITKLHNLQTLLMYGCQSLRELPEDFCKLVKLRHLDLISCFALTCMPRGMEKLTSLRVLPYYVVGKGKGKRASKYDELEALKSLTGERLQIRGRGHGWQQKRYLKSSIHLTKVVVKFEGKSDKSETVMEILEPPSTLKELHIFNYEGTRIPNWGRAVDNRVVCLSCLVNIHFANCKNLVEMPVLSKLPLLKSLILWNLEKLEYMEEIRSNESDYTELDTLFFPSLESLKIEGLEHLKGWWKQESFSSSFRVDYDDHCYCRLNMRMGFPYLSTLRIFGCHNLTSFPPCPRLEMLELIGNNERLRIVINPTSEDDSADENSQSNIRLRHLYMDDMSHLKSLPVSWLTSLTITGHEEVNKESKVEEVESHLSEVFEKCASSLQSLEFYNMKLITLPENISYLSSLKSLNLQYCRALKSLPTEMHKLTSLQRLHIWMVLELSDFTVVKLPNSIGKLQHLRYLNLSKNINLESLPNAITRLYNLQTLILRRCSSLRELPKDFCKLVKLRHLDLLYCDELICMPSDMEKLTGLEMLTYFVVGNRASKDDEFEALKSFTRVRGNMKVVIGGNHSLEKGINDNNRGYLKSMKHLTKVEIKFESIFDYHEGALEAVEPPSNVRELNIDFYSGRRIPRWGRAVDNWASSLSRLARIRLSFCQNLREMPVLSKLPLLKTLSLQYLDKLRYMEETTSDVSDIQSTELFFPSLVNLEISNIRKLKGWWKEESSSFSSLYGVDDDNRCCLNKRFKFPCLSELRIYKCPNLMSFPSCPTIEILDLVNTNKRLEIHVVDIDDDATGNPQGDFRLKRLEIDDMGYLNTLGLHHLDALKHLTLTSTCTYNVNSEDKFKACSFPKNLRSLRFTFLHQMTSLPKGMQCLTSLQDLSLSHCFNLKALPEWITCLSSLKSLNIYECPAFKSLPEAMPQLTSLQSLTIWNCPKLQERCKELDGEDHPKIQHIPRIKFNQIT
ncbi:putative disease resistance protein RGA4 [Bienertia sinuspersici]